MVQTYTPQQLAIKLQQRRESYARNREQQLAVGDNAAKKRKFGITRNQYQEMVTAQSNLCAICDKPESTTIYGKIKNLAVDHDKRYPKTHRLLLCSNCNRALGLFKEDVTTLENAIAYIEYWSQIYG